MSDIGYNDNLNVSGRKFHIQTASNITKGKARCEVFEAGTIITTHEINFERRKESDEDSLEKRVKGIVSSLHRETVSEIELMFLIAEKVKKLRHAPSNIKLGQIFQSNNLINDALEQFEVALSIDPASAEARNGLAKCYIQIGNNNKAIQLLNQALEQGDAFADIFNSLGLAYLNEKLHSKALSNFQEALSINPSYMETHYNLAIVYLESTIMDQSDDHLPPPSIRLKRAQQQLKKMENKEFKSYLPLAPRVQAAINSGDSEKAVKILIENRAKVFPPEVESLIGVDFYLKFMYGGQGLNDEIIKKFETRLFSAINKYPEYADLWNNLGIVHLTQCRNLFLQALSEFDNALEINPSFDKALKNKKLVENDGKEFLILLRAILR